MFACSRVIVVETTVFRYMVHTHCSHAAIQPLLLEITFEFDRFSEAAGVLPRRSK